MVNLNYISKLIETTINGTGDSSQHLLTLFSLALSSKSKVILELGMRNGDTTLPLLIAAKENGGIVHSVDINDSTFICPNEFKDIWFFHKMDAIEFLKQWDKDKTLDLVLVDDWHAYEHVKQELDIIDTLISPSSIVLVHDTMYNTTPYYHSDLTTNAGPQWANGGPYRALAEMNPQFFEFATLPYNNGYSLLRKKYSSKYKKK
jgi:predicted O-methyltransferase YrrM